MTRDEEMEFYFLSQPKERAVKNYYGDEEDIPGRSYFLVTDGDRKAFPELAESNVICLYCSQRIGAFCNICE